MEFRHLTTFRHVARSLSFTRSAQSLHYVQSNVSAHIRALENELGVMLFDRVGKRVALTAAGERLLPYTDRIVMLLEETRAAVVSDEEPGGTLTVAAPETLCTYRLPAVIRAFRQRAPRVRVMVSALTTDELARAIEQGDADIGFQLCQPERVRTFTGDALLDEPLVLVAAPDHRLAHAPRVDSTDLVNETFLLTGSGCAYRTLLQRRLSDSGLDPVTLEFTSVEAIKQCVAVGVGVAMLPEIAVRADLTTGNLVGLPWTVDVMLTTRLVRRDDRYLSPATAMFIETARRLMGSATVAVPPVA